MAGTPDIHWFTLGDLLRENRRSYPQRTAAVDGDVRLTYPDLEDRVNRLADALADNDVGADDRILWLGQNSFRLLECLLAAAKLGAVFCPANWRQSPDELAFVIDDCEAKVIIWQQQEVGEAIAEARKQATAADGALWLQHDAESDTPAPGGAGHLDYEAFLASGEPTDAELPIDPASSVLMLYTAAFTGRPSGACLSHTATLTQNLIMGNLQRIDSSYVFLNSGPLFHIATLMTTLATFHFGGTNVFTRRSDAEETCRLIDAERCTGAFLMGPTIDEIIELNQDGRYDLSCLRTFPGRRRWNAMVTGDDSPWAHKPAGFGQTEVMGMLTLNAWGGEAEGSVGRTAPMAQVRIIGPDGEELPPGEVGEIVARGPTVMNGLLNRDELSTARQAGNWHHTNDLGRREADGSLSWIGPKTRMIKSAAENIYPAEVEGALTKHPAVRDAAVIGIPDDKWGQSVRAVVALHDNAELTEAELIEHCRSHIASYKKPRSVRFVDAVPRDGLAIDYASLDEQFGGGGYPGGLAN